MFILIFNQLLKMLIIMVLAFACYRLKIVNQEGNKTVSNLLLMVVNPCLIITAYQTEYDADLVHGLLLAFAAACVTHIIGILVSTVCLPAKGHPQIGLERYAAIYSNCGFIGIPLVYSVLGNEGVFYLTAYMAVFNLFSWTHGLLLMTDSFSLKQLKKGLLSPMVIATVIAVVFFFIKFSIPAVLLDSMNYIADMNTPMAMMVAGFSVAQADLRKLFVNFRIYLISFVKLLVIPFVVLLVLFLCRIDSTVAYTTLIAAACPTAATLTMFAIRFEKDYSYASEIFSLSTVLSMISIPIITFAAGFLLK